MTQKRGNYLNDLIDLLFKLIALYKIINLKNEFSFRI